MKRISVALGISLLTVMLVVISFANHTSNQDKVTVSSDSFVVDLSDLNDYVYYSHNILMGQVVSNEDIGLNVHKSTFEVIENIKGDVKSKDIDVYETMGTLEKGKNYILCLTSFDSPIYPRMVYTAVTMGSIFEYSGDRVKGSETCGIKNRGLEEFIEIIKESDGYHHIVEKKNIRTYTLEDPDDIFEASDCIVHIKVLDVYGQSKISAMVEIEVIDNLKGVFTDTVLILPSEVKVESEYLVYLVKLYDGSYTLTSRKNSLITPAVD